MSSHQKKRPQGSELSQAQLHNPPCLRALLCLCEILIGLFSSCCLSQPWISILNIWTKNYVHFVSLLTSSCRLELWKKKQKQQTKQKLKRVRKTVEYSGIQINCFTAQNLALVGKSTAQYSELHLQLYSQWPLLKTLGRVFAFLFYSPASSLMYPHAASCLSRGTSRNSANWFA